MEDQRLPVDAPPVVAMVQEKEVSESRKRFDQVVQREVQDAVERKQFEVAAALAKAGVPINEFPYTEEGSQQLAAWMKEHKIQVNKIVIQEDFTKSGYYIERSGVLLEFVPCEIVRGVMV